MVVTVAAAVAAAAVVVVVVAVAVGRGLVVVVVVVIAAVTPATPQPSSEDEPGPPPPLRRRRGRGRPPTKRECHDYDQATWIWCSDCRRVQANGGRHRQKCLGPDGPVPGAVLRTLHDTSSGDDEDDTDALVGRHVVRMFPEERGLSTPHLGDPEKKTGFVTFCAFLSYGAT